MTDVTAEPPPTAEAFYGVRLPPPPSPATPDRGGPPDATRAGGWFRATFNPFIDYTLRRLSGNEAKVWMALCRFADARTRVACPSHATVAERAGCCVRTVRNVVKRLRGKGLLEVVRQGGLRRGSNAYRLHPVGAAGGHSSEATDPRPRGNRPSPAEAPAVAYLQHDQGGPPGAAEPDPR